MICSAVGLQCAYLTPVAGVSFGAGAAERLHAIVTRSSVEAGLRVAFVHLVLAVVAGEPRAACAGEAVDLVHTRSTVKARTAGHT